MQSLPSPLKNLAFLESVEKLKLETRPLVITEASPVLLDFAEFLSVAPDNRTQLAVPWGAQINLKLARSEKGVYLDCRVLQFGVGTDEAVDCASYCQEFSVTDRWITLEHVGNLGVVRGREIFQKHQWLEKALTLSNELSELRLFIDLHMQAPETASHGLTEILNRAERPRCPDKQASTQPSPVF